MKATAPVIRDVTVSDDGIRMRGRQDRAIDVKFDGRRVWSFWSRRDTVADGRELLARWPDALRRFLDGTTTLALVDHVNDEELFSAEIRLGAGSGRIRVEDADGHPLGLDKSNRLSRLFESRSAEHTQPLLDSMRSVVDALAEAGVEAFMAYGTLLGAVRQGGLIGHDSDADLGYVSRHDQPADAILESFRLQRALTAMGYPVTRYSGLAFKVLVTESDGAVRGLDVFGGFLRDGLLYLMGEVGHPFRADWIFPTTEIEFEGRPFPAPAQPDHLLEAMYGPSWRVPDPAYKFETPHSTVRRLNGWFRGTRVGRERVWDRYYGRPAKVAEEHPNESAFVHWVAEREPDMVTAVDIGCGTGRDAAWLAGRGVTTWGLDYAARGFRREARRAREAGLPVTFQWANLTELRSVLATGAQLSREPGPRVVLARHVADTTDDFGRLSLLRLARMVTGRSGRLHLQVQTGPSTGDRRFGVSPLDLTALLRQVAATGGRVIERADLVELDDGGTAAAGSTAAGTPISRLVITWTS
ncbi:LicD family protein [Nocardioides jensenii]|uniref:LicD family protein n=1 Tax=Nocardioides jensenii TaxID=1843 RepID=UPI00082B72FA|nr:LicD family protein [Nocardioides jensenii]